MALKNKTEGAPLTRSVLQEFSRLFAAHEGEPMIFFSPMLWPLIVWDFWLLQWHPRPCIQSLLRTPITAISAELAPVPGGEPGKAIRCAPPQAHTFLGGKTGWGDPDIHRAVPREAATLARQIDGPWRAARSRLDQVPVAVRRPQDSLDHQLARERRAKLPRARAPMPRPPRRRCGPRPSHDIGALNRTVVHSAANARPWTARR